MNNFLKLLISMVLLFVLGFLLWFFWPSLENAYASRVEIAIQSQDEIESLRVEIESLRAQVNATNTPSVVATATPPSAQATAMVPTQTPTARPTDLQGPDAQVPPNVTAPRAGVEEVSDVPQDFTSWLTQQSFTSPLCDPQTYLGWSNKEFDPTGGELNRFDMTVPEEQMAVVWGTNVSIGEVNYGRSLVVLETGRYSAEVVDGAYRYGIDQWGFFELYWQKVLTCLYGGQWPIVYHDESSVATPAPQSRAEFELPESILLTQEQLPYEWKVGAEGNLAICWGSAKIRLFVSDASLDGWDACRLWNASSNEEGTEIAANFVATLIEEYPNVDWKLVE